MKRVFRAGWVLAANGSVAFLMFARLLGVGFPNGDGALALELWFEFF